MPAVFIHGVPDTPQVWDAILSRIQRRDIVTLALPGFASPLPPQFDATKEAYVDWLIESVARLETPIDIVGHDWGALLTVRAVSLRPDLFRSWAVGGAPLDPEYTWHETAQAWQTPEVGEQIMEAMTEEAMEAGLVQAGVPPEDAARTAARVDPIMKDCILKLYRSAREVGREWWPESENLRPRGLVLWGENDPYADVSFGRKLADRTGARFISFEACGHWWPLERPDEVSAELATHWAER